MAHAQLQEFDKDYAAARLHCRFLTTWKFVPAARIPSPGSDTWFRGN